jgi:hypothetical protein
MWLVGDRAEAGQGALLGGLQAQRAEGAPMCGFLLLRGGRSHRGVDDDDALHPIPDVAAAWMAA